MDSRADMRNVTTILLSEDSSPVGTVGTATWAIAPAKEKQEFASGVSVLVIT